jgi:menaquinone-specific isochorismate synthase
MLKWVEEETRFPKVYWRERGSARAIGAVGTGGSGPTFGGATFEGESFFFQPEELREGSEENRGDELAKVVTRIDLPDRKTWESQAERALDEFKRGTLEKVVLARRTTLICSQKINPFDVLRKLQASNTTLFLFQPDSRSAFLGATPEHLFERSGNTVRTEAIAATWPRGVAVSIGDKEEREHAYVADFLSEILSPIATSIEIGKSHIIQAGAVQHLKTALIAQLKASVSDRELLKLLHPTPAVCGTPSAEARALIRELEMFERGWYAAPLGWIFPDSAQFAVAIRSALVEGEKIHLYAGVGLVAGSDPDKEWDELEQKIQPILRCFV